MLRIQLLSGFHLFLDNQPVQARERQRQQALLAYLLLYRDAPPLRQQVAFTFWPDSTEAQAFSNLRKLFYDLRQTLPRADDYLFADGLRLGWRRDAHYTLDIEELEQTLDELEQTAVPDVKTVEKVVALYRGELLPTCYDDWILPLRRALHERVVNTLEQAIQGLEAQRAYEAGLRAAEHLRRLDPLHEATYRHLMHLRALMGDRSGALRVYHECATVLEQELGVSPATETQAIYQQLLKVEPQAIPPSAPAPAQRHEYIPLVGRKAEWQVLQQAWQQMVSRGPQMIVVWGEAGAGKTRLVEELLRWAELRPGTVAAARAYAAEGALAYAPLTEWIGSEAVRQAIAGLPDLWQTELARLLPELLTENPELPPPAPLNEGWQRQRFQEALARALLAAPRPLLLALDDLQWCDGETLAWLHYLLRYDMQVPLLVVGTVRSEAVAEASDEPHLLADLRRQLQRTVQWSEIKLSPLDQAETAALAGHLTEENVAVWAEQLYRETEGNPLFVMEMVRAGIIPGQDNMQNGQATSLPPTVQAVIGARLAQLSPSARQLVQLAAATGRAFTFDILAMASEASEAELVHDLDELWRRRIVREQGPGYDFSHDKIREVAYAELSPMRRRWVHGRIAQALEGRYAANLSEVSGLLAAHWERAGESQRATTYALSAGDYALATYAPQQAYQQYTRVLSLSNEPSVKMDALLGLGRAHFALEDFATAIAQAEQALALTAETTYLPRRAKLLHFLAEAWFARYDVDRCEMYAQAALQAADTIQDQEMLCQCLSLLGQVCSARGDLEPEVRLIRRALEICRQTGNRWREGRTLADLGWLQALLGEFGDAVGAAHAALACLADGNDRTALAFAWNVLGRAQGGSGHYTAAFVAFGRSQEIAAAIDHKFLLAQVPNMRGWLYQQLGDYAQALQYDQEGVELAQAWSKTPAEISARINVALDILHLGDPEQALAQLDVIQARIEQEANGFHAWRWRLRLLEGQGWCYLALGQPQRARQLAQEETTLAQTTSSRKYIAGSLALRGQALAQLEQPEAAIAALEQAIALVDPMGYAQLRWQRRGDLARLYQTVGRQADAQACYRQAIAIVQAIAADLADDSLRTGFLNAPTVQTLLGTAAAHLQ